MHQLCVALVKTNQVLCVLLGEYHHGSALRIHRGAGKMANEQVLPPSLSTFSVFFFNFSSHFDIKSVIANMTIIYFTGKNKYDTTS